MPITVGALKKDRRTTTLTYGSEEVTVTYKPSALTPEVEDTLREAYSEADSPSTVFLEHVVNLVEEWDVLEADNGPTLPITVENLRKLPSAFTNHIVRKVMEDMNPGEVRSPSGVGSRRRG